MRSWVSNFRAATFLILAFSLAVSLVSHGQTPGKPKVTRNKFNSQDSQRARQKKALGLDTLAYRDSTFNFQVKVPGWLHLRETGSRRLWGGTLPAVDGIENAIMVTGFLKSEFKSFADFEDTYLTGNVFGQPTKYSKNMTWYGQNDLIQIDHGVKQKVFTFWGNKIYHNQFVLLETKTAYLWIQFVATSETYDRNIAKFDEFMRGFTITNF